MAQAGKQDRRILSFAVVLQIPQLGSGFYLAVETGCHRRVNEIKHHFFNEHSLSQNDENRKTTHRQLVTNCCT